MSSVLLDVCEEVAKNMAMGIAPLRAWRLKKPRTSLLFTGRDEELEHYAFIPVRSLLGVLGGVEGLDIVEVGPGDFLSSGLALLAAGAASYTVIDRFPGQYQSREAKQWYVGVQRAWARLFPQLRWPAYLRAEEFPEAHRDRVKVLTGGVEEARSTQRYDIVCSYQVGEHVSDIGAFAQANARLLKSNGIAVHRVDFGPHDCWVNYKDPLTFLRFPDWLWSLMGSNRGTANRRRHHEFCSAFEEAGLKVDVSSREFFDDKSFDRKRFATRFRHISDDSLATKTGVYVCRPKRTSSGENPEAMS